MGVVVVGGRRLSTLPSLDPPGGIGVHTTASINPEGVTLALRMVSTTEPTPPGD